VGYLIIRFRIRMPEIRIDRIISSRLIIISIVLIEMIKALIAITGRVARRTNSKLKTAITPMASSRRRAVETLCDCCEFKRFCSLLLNASKNLYNQFTQVKIFFK